MFSLIFVSFILLPHSVLALEGDKPTMAVEIFRHGARTVIHHVNDYFMFNDPESLLPAGQRQQYNLGKMLAEKYPHLLESTDPKYIYARSSEPIRCIMSLQAQMFGAFEGKIPNVSNAVPHEAILPVFQDDTLVSEVAAELSTSFEAIPNGFIPFSYETKSIYEEEMLHVAPWNCKYVEQKQNERLADDTNQPILAFMADTLTALRSKGFTINNMQEFAYFGEVLNTMHLSGRDAELPEDLKYGSLIFNDTKFTNEWYASYYYVGDEVERSVKMRNLLAQIIDWFQGVANGTNTLKFSFMSGHETSYLALLRFYGIYNHTCKFENYKAERSGQEAPYPDCVFPEYASQIIYEIYNETESGDPYVKFLYNGKPFKICEQGTGPECKLSDFISETKKMLLYMTKEEMSEYCTYGYKLSDIGVPETPSKAHTKPSFDLNLWLVTVLGLIVVILGYVIVRGKRMNIVMKILEEVKRSPIELV